MEITVAIALWLVMLALLVHLVQLTPASSWWRLLMWVALVLATVVLVLAGAIHFGGGGA